MCNSASCLTHSLPLQIPRNKGKLETMAIEVSPVNKSQDWDDLFASFWTAWPNPLQAVGQLTFPYLGEGSTREGQSFQDCKLRSYEATAHDPNDYWAKAPSG